MWGRHRPAPRRAGHSPGRVPRTPAWLLLALCAFGSAEVCAGPPLRSDDPHTIGPGRVELIVALDTLGDEDGPVGTQSGGESGLRPTDPPPVKSSHSRALRQKALLNYLCSDCVPTGLATAVALGMSGLTSAYISESAEKQKELRELETAMLADLKHSAHGRAARLMPVAIALVNGLSPFVIALLIMVPLWLGVAGVAMPLSPLDASIAAGFAAAFLLGVFVGTVNETFWLWAGLRATAVAGATAGLILLLAPR